MDKTSFDNIVASINNELKSSSERSSEARNQQRNFVRNLEDSTADKSTLNMTRTEAILQQLCRPLKITATSTIEVIYEISIDPTGHIYNDSAQLTSQTDVAQSEGANLKDPFAKTAVKILEKDDGLYFDHDYLVIYNFNSQLH
ncbi:hypothetical protein DMENIID0001_119630 [Sergentomyia squamirostris]